MFEHKRSRGLFRKPKFIASICNFSPEGLQSRSHAEYVAGDTLKDMVKEDLIAERIAIDSYREIATYLGDKDPTTRRIMEEILAQEEEHADDMASILESL